MASQGSLGLRRWKWHARLLDSLEKSKEDLNAKWFQLATIGRGGSPSVRSVVLRDTIAAHGGTSILQVYTTDIRSEKVKELVANAKAEACIYHAKTREQFRLRGNVFLVGSRETVAIPKHLKDVFNWEERRHSSWEKMPEDIRATFANAAPGEPLSDDASVGKASGDAGYENFALLVLDVNRVDVANLAGKPNTRTIYTIVKDEGGEAHEEVVEVNA
ncbi:hypothetical protein DFS34DRAFT_230026 [Phlyctochytrium arcticum]|nr:hypothetical protein DFS34DRAFT_230026 [Phlyctochytrium arcticum]